MLNYQIVTVGHFAQNATLIWCNETKTAAVIDPGGEVEQFIDLINKNQLKLEKILLTHGHIDHIYGAKKLANYYNIPIFGPSIEDKFLFDAIALQCEWFNFSPISAFLPDFWLKKNEKVKLGNNEFLVLFVPGHTPGHIAFLVENQNIVFSGDVLFRESIGRTDLPQGNYETLFNSIKHSLFTLPENTIVYPGHGEKTTISHEKQYNSFLNKK